MRQMKDPLVGQTLGPMKILSCLGRGGVGVVYLAEMEGFQRHVAVKKLHDPLTKQPRARERFSREAQVLAKLKHANIVQLYDYLELPEGVFMVLEFVRGETLESGVQRLGAFEWDRLVPWFCQALDALEYAHERGIIHRDIKPGNLLIDMASQLKVLDFGMAKLQFSEQQLTAPGMTLGTIAYMSKEQLLGKKLDPSSDFYSLGVSLYELATGNLPFWKENNRELAIAIARSQPKAPRQLNAKLSVKAESVILKSLGKTPDSRFQDSESFRQALRKTLQ